MCRLHLLICLYLEEMECKYSIANHWTLLTQIKFTRPVVWTKTYRGGIEDITRFIWKIDIIQMKMLTQTQPLLVSRCYNARKQIMPQVLGCACYSGSDEISAAILPLNIITTIIFSIFGSNASILFFVTIISFSGPASTPQPALLLSPLKILTYCGT